MSDSTGSSRGSGVLEMLRMAGSIGWPWQILSDGRHGGSVPVAVHASITGILCSKRYKCTISGVFVIMLSCGKSRQLLAPLARC